MTIALAARVFDGLVFAADSASTILFDVDNCPHPHTVNVFNNGEKITNLHKSLPIGMITWGLGTIASHSINWHGKELRRRFEGDDSRFPAWKLDPNAYHLSEVAKKVHEYFSSFQEFAIPTTSAFGLLIAGYSSLGELPEAYSIESIYPVQPDPAAVATDPAAVATDPAAVATDPAAVATDPAAVATDPAAVATDPAAVATDPAAVATDPAAVATDPAAVATDPAAVATDPALVTIGGLSLPIERLTGSEVILFFGQPEAIERLTVGFSSSLAVPLRKVGVLEKDLPGLLSFFKDHTRNTLVTTTMPIQDVIDLAHFLVDTTIKYVRFSAGPNTVGGSIDLAAITRHEGFKWVNRKHYYPSELNP